MAHLANGKWAFQSFYFKRTQAFSSPALILWLSDIIKEYGKRRWEFSGMIVCWQQNCPRIIPSNHVIQVYSTTSRLKRMCKAKAPYERHSAIFLQQQDIAAASMLSLELEMTFCAVCDFRSAHIFWLEGKENLVDTAKYSLYGTKRDTNWPDKSTSDTFNVNNERME